MRISYFGRVFKLVKIIFNSYFWKPLPSKGGWMGDHALHALIENLFNMCMNRVVGMSYTHDLHVILFLYAHMYFLYIYASNFNWYFHTYIYMIWLCLQHLYILKYKLFLTKLDLLLNVNYFSIGILYKLMHYFYWYFINGEKTHVLSFNQLCFQLVSYSHSLWWKLLYFGIC